MARTQVNGVVGGMTAINIKYLSRSKVTHYILKVRSEPELKIVILLLKRSVISNKTVNTSNLGLRCLVL